MPERTPKLSFVRFGREDLPAKKCEESSGMRSWPVANESCRGASLRLYLHRCVELSGLLTTRHMPLTLPITSLASARRHHEG